MIRDEMECYYRYYCVTDYIIENRIRIEILTFDAFYAFQH